MKIRTITAIILLLFTTGAAAQFRDGSSGTVAEEKYQEVWTLKDCMLYAIANSRDAKAQLAENDSRRVEHRSAYLDWLPDISASTSASTSFGRNIDPNTNVYNNITSFSNSYSISADYTIFNGFSVVNNYRVTRIAKLSGIEESKRIEDEICLNVIQAYFNVLYRAGMVRITREKLEESLTRYRQTSIMEELGLKSHAELLQVEAEVATNDFNCTKEQNNLEAELLTLKGIMFYPLEKELAIDTNLAIAIDPYTIGESADSIFEAARTFLPEILIAKYNTETARLEHQTAKLQILPNIYAQAGLSTGYMTYLNGGNVSAGFARQMSSNLGEYVGIGMSIPIFSGLERHANVTKTRNEYKKALYEEEKNLQEVATEIRKSVQDMQGAAKEYIQADKLVRAYQAAYQANLKKYEEGLISIIDLQTSANELLSSKAERLNSALSYMLRNKIVNYYKGIHYLAQ